VQRVIGEKIWEEVRWQGILGEREFVEKLGEHLRKYKEIPTFPRANDMRTGPSSKRS